MTPWADRCGRCDRQCERSVEPGLRLCSYGVNYQRVDVDLLVTGVVVRDYPGVPTGARKKALRAAGKSTISRHDLQHVLGLARESTLDLEREVRARKNDVIAAYQESKEYQADVLELLRPELERTLAQVHDYKQFVQQILQNMDVLLEARSPGMSLEDKVTEALHEEAAIYWAARLMDEKIDAALVMLYPDRMHNLADRGQFRFHGLATKYLKIYKSQIEAKNLRVHQDGESWGKIEGSARAIGIIPHAFLDNAVKYAPHNTRIVVSFQEEHENLTYSVESFGPVIQPEELHRVFELFFRGQEASRRNAEGTGFGLAAAANVAKELEFDLSVEQTSRPGPAETLWTKFTLRMPVAVGGQPPSRAAPGRTK